MGSHSYFVHCYAVSGKIRGEGGREERQRGTERRARKEGCSSNFWQPRPVGMSCAWMNELCVSRCPESIFQFPSTPHPGSSFFSPTGWFGYILRQKTSENPWRCGRGRGSPRQFVERVTSCRLSVRGYLVEHPERPLWAHLLRGPGMWRRGTIATLIRQHQMQGFENTSDSAFLRAWDNVLKVSRTALQI